MFSDSKYNPMNETTPIHYVPNFAKPYIIKKDVTPKPQKTNTRIGNTDENIVGGSFHVGDTEYPSFLGNYFRDIVAQGKPEYFTELQRQDNAPLLVDIDLRFSTSITERVYTKIHVDDIIDKYLDVLSDIFEFDEDSEFKIFVLEKQGINRQPDLVKDGIHLIFGINVSRFVQVHVRKQMVELAPNIWDDIGELITNSWEDVFDSSISNGTTGWQLYGSRKPAYEAYSLTRTFKATFNENLGKMTVKTTNLPFVINETSINELSARCLTNPKYAQKHTFHIIEEQERQRIATELQQKQQSKLNNINAEGVVTGKLTPFQIALSTLTYNVADFLLISCKEELDNFIANNFMEKILKSIELESLLEVYNYLLILPAPYFDHGSYDKLMRVGWALYNTSPLLFPFWVKLKSRREDFDYDIMTMWEKWNGMTKSETGCQLKSIVYWARQENPNEYSRIKHEVSKQFINLIVDSGSVTDIDVKSGCDVDIARMLYKMFQYDYRCSSIKGNIWYRFMCHRWAKDDSGTSLRRKISEELSQLITTMMMDNMFALKNRPTINAGLPEMEYNNLMDIEAKEVERLKFKHKRFQFLISRLGQTQAKNSVMTEAKELFYDNRFMEKIDTNTHLLCFTNGVFDFEHAEFRDGKPEDYVTLCTNIPYEPIDEENPPESKKKFMIDIKDFMSKLFPIESLENYMWQHLASILLGKKETPTFHMYIGDGRNGKSALMMLLKKMLGEYAGMLPLAAITEADAKVGGLTPELIEIKGMRLVDFPEAKEGMTLNDGAMKKISSCTDPIQCRAPYDTKTTTFTPQSTLIAATNHPFVIKTNDYGTWRRIRNIQFPSLFTEPEKLFVEFTKTEKPYQFLIDLTLESKFDEWRIVLMAMLVNIVVKTKGHVDVCDFVTRSTEKYRQGQDFIAEFIDNKIVVCEGGFIQKTDLNTYFTKWFCDLYGNNPKLIPPMKSVYEYFEKKYGKVDKQNRINGIVLSHSDSSVGEDDETDNSTIASIH